MRFPVLTIQELASELRRSHREFEQRRDEVLDARITERFDEAAEGLAHLLRESDDLRNLDAAFDAGLEPAGASRERGGLHDVVRLLTMPPLGPEDIGDRGWPKRSTGPPRDQNGTRERIVERLSTRLDRRRFPWLAEDRQPTDCEREIAVSATATLAVAQSLPVLSRHALAHEEKRFYSDLGELAWERLPRGVPLRHLAAGTYVSSPFERGGPDVAMRFSDGDLALVELKAQGARSALGSHRIGETILRSLTPRNGDLPSEEPLHRVLVLYGEMSLESLMGLQEAGVNIVFGHQVPARFDPSAHPNVEVPADLAESERRSEAPEVRQELPPASARGPDLGAAERVIRDAAARVRDLPLRNAKVGRLGRRKGVGPSDPYLAQYVHFTTPEDERLSIWIYFAAEGHPYNAAAHGTGFWVGLKRDPAQELPEQEWAERLAPPFEWTQHLDPRWAGFRHFLNHGDGSDDPEGTADAIVEWIADTMSVLGFT